LIGHDLAGRFGTGGKHASEKPLRRSLVSTFLQQDSKLGAVLIDCTPKQIRLAAQRRKHFVEVPGRTRLSTRSPDTMREARAEFIAPTPDRLIPTGLPSGRS
jgi:hypothetical protein